MIYQTKLTETVLRQIESVSRVAWVDGDLPTGYYVDHGEDEDRYLNIAESCLYDAQVLFWGEKKNDRVQCTAEEFVAVCQRLFPRDAGEKE